jgi:hypothetical protein
MLAPQSGQTSLRIEEIKLDLVFVTTASEAIMSLPAVATLHRRMHNRHVIHNNATHTNNGVSAEQGDMSW